MGRWGTASGMPIRCDQSRCCAELAAKQQLRTRLEQGVLPWEDYDLSNFDETATAMQQRADTAIEAAVSQPKEVELI